MKKIVSMLIIASFLNLSVYVSAAPGDIVGDVYSTDIMTYMYYAPVTSYNIGGKTCIDAEILNWHYGFDVYWYETERHLDIIDKGGRFVSLQAMNGETVESTISSPGNVLCSYYETDIITTLNGKKIESYNIGGRTVICAEAMREHGYNVEWDKSKRTLTISKPMDFYKYETDLGTVKSTHNFVLKRDTNIFNERELIVKKDEKDYLLNFPSNIVYADDWRGLPYIKLTDLSEVLGGECYMEEKTETYISEWVNGVADEHEEYTYIFNLNYNPDIQPELVEYNGEEFETEYSDNTGQVIDLSTFPFMINGEEYVSTKNFRGMDFSARLMSVNGEVYVSANILTELFGYEHIR